MNSFKKSMPVLAFAILTSCILGNFLTATPKAQATQNEIDPCLITDNIVNEGCSPTPTVTPTPTPECDGQRCINLDCNGGGDCEIVIGHTPTPTPTEAPTVTPTPTPTSTPSNNNNNDNPKSNNNSSTPSNPAPAVIAARTMAPTGGFAEILSNSLLGLGLTFSTLAGATYAKKKK